MNQTAPPAAPKVKADDVEALVPLTVMIAADLRVSMRVAALKQGRKMQDVVPEALRAWLTEQE